MHMKENIIIDLPKQASSGCQGALEEILREGAQRMLQQAIENEVTEYLEAHTDQRDEQGHRLVVRNGRRPRRSILTPSGAVEIQQPRVEDRRREHKFASRILPP